MTRWGQALNCPSPQADRTTEPIYLDCDSDFDPDEADGEQSPVMNSAASDASAPQVRQKYLGVDEQPFRFGTSSRSTTS